MSRMMPAHLLRLAWASAWNRRSTLLLTVLSIALAVCLLLGVERLRQGLEAGFTQAISGADLVVGARGSPLQLVLYAVFHLGEATHNLGWQAYEDLSRHPAVAWAVPLSLGDSHRGYPVVGTRADYFRHYRHGEGLSLRLSEGRPFRDGVEDLYAAVLGAEVARALGYRLGEHITLAHGAGTGPLAEHADKPFTVVGILQRTGTPVDRAVHISLESLEAIHLDWQAGTPIAGLSIPAAYARKFDLTPKAVTAVILGLHSRAAVFNVQRHIHAYAPEPLMAVLPGVALGELWEVVGVGQRALLLISALVVLVGLAGLIAVVLAGLNERRRELAILRSVGARPLDVLLLLTVEGLLIALAGILLGLVLLTALGLAAGPWVATHYGITLKVLLPTAGEAALLGLVFLVALAASLLPAWRAYRLSLADGLTPRL